MTREQIEAAIRDEERVLALVAHLLETRCDLEHWPAEARDALALALAAPPGSADAWRALALERHLFGSDPNVSRRWRLEPPAVPTPILQRQAERLRSDLIAIVRFRAGARIGTR